MPTDLLIPTARSIGGVPGRVLFGALVLVALARGPKWLRGRSLLLFRRRGGVAGRG